VNEFNLRIVTDLNIDELIALINEAIRLFNDCIKSQEFQNGWTEESARNAKKWLLYIRSSIKNGKDLNTLFGNWGPGLCDLGINPKITDQLSSALIGIDAVLHRVPDWDQINNSILLYLDYRKDNTSLNVDPVRVIERYDNYLGAVLIQFVMMITTQLFNIKPNLVYERWQFKPSSLKTSMSVNTLTNKFQKVTYEESVKQAAMHSVHRLRNLYPKLNSDAQDALICYFLWTWRI
jgi:hypothetical protein